MSVEGLRGAALVDDNDIDRMLCERIIRRTALFDPILSFDDPVTALEELVRTSARDVAVLFTRIRMPGLSGFELVERLGSALGDRFDELVVAIVTTSSDPLDLERADAIDAVRFYIDRPFSPAHVEEVDRYLGTRRPAGRVPFPAV